MGVGGTGGIPLGRGSCGWAGAVATAAGGATRGRGLAALGGMVAGAAGGGVLSAGMRIVSADTATGARRGGSDTTGSGFSLGSRRADSVPAWTLGVTGSGVTGGLGS